MTVRVNEDQRIHGERKVKKPSSSTHIVYLRRGDGAVMNGFWQYKRHSHTKRQATLYMNT
jgi:hypothetical protein